MNGKEIGTPGRTVPPRKLSVALTLLKEALDEECSEGLPHDVVEELRNFFESYELVVSVDDDDWNRDSRPNLEE